MPFILVINAAAWIAEIYDLWWKTWLRCGETQVEAAEAAMEIGAGSGPTGKSTTTTTGKALIYMFLIQQ